MHIPHLLDLYLISFFGAEELGISRPFYFLPMEQKIRVSFFAVVVD
jgi:hypothetical protein